MLYTKDSSMMKYVVHANHVVTYLGNTPAALLLLAQGGFAAQLLAEGQGLIDQVQNAFAQRWKV